MTPWDLPFGGRLLLCAPLHRLPPQRRKLHGGAPWGLTNFPTNGLVEGKIYRKTPYVMGKTMENSWFPVKIFPTPPIHWSEQLVLWRFPWSWGIPNSWMVYFRDNPNLKLGWWLGVPLFSETFISKVLQSWLDLQNSKCLRYWLVRWNHDSNGFSSESCGSVASSKAMTSQEESERLFISSWGESIGDAGPLWIYEQDTQRSPGINQGLVSIPIEHHPNIGDIISSKYLKVMFKIPKMGHLPTPVNIQKDAHRYHSFPRKIIYKWGRFPRHVSLPGGDL